MVLIFVDGLKISVSLDDPAQVSALRSWLVAKSAPHAT